MSILDHDRFHRAARDGYLDLLQEGNRKELNTQDEDGMTPAMWAAYYGHLDALRLIVGRGGDPDKCDHYGNTALHCASGNGHINCVSFLVNFGVNLWALDNDFHTAKDVAVLNHRDEVLRLLDQAQAKHSCVNKKLVQRLKEKSIADAEKRIKSYRKLQMKAAKRLEKEEKILERQRKRMSEVAENEVNSSTRLAAFRRDSRLLYGASPRYSDIVHSDPGGGGKRVHGAVSKRAQHHKKSDHGDDKVRDGTDGVGDHDNGDGGDGNLGNNADQQGGMEITPGLRRDSEVTYVPKCELSDIVEDHCDSLQPKDALDSSSDDANSDFHQTADSGIGDELVVPEQPPSIFDRPGFGTVAFRTSLITLPSLYNGGSGIRHHHPLHLHHHHHLHSNGSVSDSIGSASSLARRHISWDDDELEKDDGETEDEEDEDDDEEDDESGDEGEPIVLFLSAHGLTEYVPLFQKEKIDLESLLLLTEEDFKVMGMPLGPRRKLEKALEQRKNALEEPGTVEDSRL